MAARHSYVMHVMALLAARKRSERAPRAWRIDEVRRELQARSQGTEFTVPAIGDLEDVLLRLAELGVLERLEQPEDTVAWRFNPYLVPVRNGDGSLALGGSMEDSDGPALAGGAFGRPPGEPPQQPDGDDGGGSGLGEVIAHRVLLCIDDPAFDALLDDALRDAEDGVAEEA